MVNKATILSRKKTASTKYKLIHIDIASCIKSDLEEGGSCLMGPAFVLQDEASCGWMEAMVAQL